MCATPRQWQNMIERTLCDRNFAFANHTSAFRPCDNRLGVDWENDSLKYSRMTSHCVVAPFLWIFHIPNLSLFSPEIPIVDMPSSHRCTTLYISQSIIHPQTFPISMIVFAPRHPAFIRMRIVISLGTVSTMLKTFFERQRSPCWLRFKYSFSSWFHTLFCSVTRTIFTPLSTPFFKWDGFCSFSSPLLDLLFMSFIRCAIGILPSFSMCFLVVSKVSAFNFWVFMGHGISPMVYLIILRLSREQREVIAKLRAAGQDVFVWRPSDREQMEQALA